MKIFILIFILLIILSCKDRTQTSSNNTETYNNPDLTKYHIKPNSSYNEIITKMEAAKLVDPENIFIYILLGDTYSEKKEYVKAVENYKKVIMIKPDNIAGYNSLGTCYMELNNGKLAAYYLEEGLSKCKDNKQKFDCIDLIQNIATTYLFYGVYNDVKKDMAKVINYSNEGLKYVDKNENMLMYTRFEYLLGEAYLKLSANNDYEKAISYFKDVIKYKKSPWYDISKEKLNEAEKKLGGS